MPLRDDLLTPIEGDEPAGPYLRYEPIYDEIKEARKDNSLLVATAQKQSGGPPVELVRADWRKVAELAETALATESKDLQLAAWLTEAQLHREGYAGLREGLQLVFDLLDQLWDAVHPQIEDGDSEMRAAPLAWIGSDQLAIPARLAPVDARGHTFEQYRDSRSVPAEDEAAADEGKRDRRAEAIADGKLTPEEFDAGFQSTPKDWYKQLLRDIDGSLALVGRIEKLGEERLGLPQEDTPSFKPLRDALKEVRVGAVALLERKLQLDPDPPEEEPVDLESVPGEEGAAVSVEPRSRDDAAKRIAIAARFLRHDAPTNPAPYLMVRGLRWGELRVDGDAPNPRLLAAPPTEIRTRLKGLLLDARWGDLLDGAEEIMATPYGRGWLDLQRYVLTACDGLGAGYQAVAHAIRGALRSLLRDIPALVDMTLMDDSPTANAETRRWLQAQGIGPGTADEDDGAPEAPAVTGGALDRTVASIRASSPQRAIEMLMKAAAREQSERAAFLRRAEAAAIMVEHGLEPVALPILQELEQKVTEHGLEAWEAGDLIARPLGLLYQCMEKLELDYSARQALYLRVCRLDPVQAIRFTSQTGTADEGGE